ncbi:MAG: glycosyltransferase, partial [Flavobacteriaceae bacterium]|nr:glycosyltransferase [Flavobacteriaceae bacterium]
MAKRVLIITYYWPPAGGPGVQRWLMFVKYFKRFGIEPIVYIPEGASYPLVDEKLSSEIDTEVEIISTPVKEPYKLAQLFSKKQTQQLSRGIISSSEPSFVEKLLLFIRGNFFIPDARVGWVPPSISYLSKYIAENTIDSIVTTGPPHSLHLIGMKLKEQLSIPWLADFRDPWTTIHYHKKLRLTKSAAKKHQQLEKKVLTTADQIVVTSPTTKTEFEAITNRPIEVITNGYDINSEEKQSLDDKFTLAHIGSLLTERNPLILWEVLAELVE